MSTLSFTRKGKPCQVVLHPDSMQVSWLKKPGKTVQVDIPYTCLLAVDDCTASVTVHYVRPVSNRRLRANKLTLQSDQPTCSQLVCSLQQQLTGLQRPRHLAVIINPNSGKKQAEKVFSKQVQPLFQLCGIESTVFVTKAPKQALEILQTLELSNVDGVITVGGDGLYCEVMTGLLLRVQKDHGVDVNDPSVTAIPSNIPIGIIPAGTGDMVVQYLHGTRDVVTAALRVVLGGHVATNAVSVHQGGCLSAYAGLVLGFGLQGDMMADCERFRWMGQSRYNVIPISTVLNRRCHDLEVEYQEDDANGGEGELQRTCDVMYSVDTYVVSKQERGEHVQHVFGSDSLTVYMTSKCPLTKHVQQLTKLKENSSGSFDYDFLHKAKVQAYTVRLRSAVTEVRDGQKVLKDKYSINCDGEVLRVTHPEFNVRLHRHAIRLFGEAAV